MKSLVTLLALFAALASASQLFAEPGKLDVEGKAAGRAAQRKTAKPDADGKKKAGSKAGRQQQVLREFDADGDGKLNREEQSAARKAAAERRKNKGKGKPGQPGAAGQPQDPNQGIGDLNGQPIGGGAAGGAAGPRGDGRAKLLERFDMNRDGQLNADEMARARQFMQNRGPGQRRPNLPNRPNK